jgi:hypothetical protein
VSRLVPGRQHEALIELFRRDPELVARTLRETFGVPVPPHTGVRLECGDLTEWVPTEYRADAVIVLETTEPVLAVIVEVQLGRDPGKRRTWPVYLTTLHARLKVPTVLLVVCPDAAIARWSAKPILTGHPGWVLSPLVYGPEQIPVITDPAVATRDPDLTTLSALAHGAGPEGKAVLEVFVEALQVINPEQRHSYTDIVLAAVGEAARTHLEALLNWEGYKPLSDWGRRHYAEGEARGEAKGEARGVAKGEAIALLRVLEARGIAVPEAERELIAGCQDLSQLQEWLTRAATATSLDEVIAYERH